MAVHSVCEEGIMTITLARPERRNAVDGPTAAALADAFRAFESDESARVAVLTGAGGVFCAGADLKALAGQANSNALNTHGDGPMGPTRMQLSKPVIAAIEGYAVAGGLELALWCDLRVASRSAVLGVFCRRFGVPLIDGGTIRLARLIGQSRALDMVLTGRAVEAEEALSFGLVNRVVSEGHALAAAQVLAHQIAAYPQLCMRNDRRSLYEQWSLPLEQALAHEFELGLATINSGETLQGALRFEGGAGRGGQSAS